MAKSDGKSAGGAKAEPKTDEPKTEAMIDATEDESSELAIVMARDKRCGEVELVAGDVIARIQLRPGVNLNYLVAAIGNGFAREE